MGIKTHTRSNKWYLFPGLQYLSRLYLTFQDRQQKETAIGMIIRVSSCLKSCNVLKMTLNAYSSGAAVCSTLQLNALGLTADNIATEDCLHSTHFGSSASLQRLPSHICYAIAES